MWNPFKHLKFEKPVVLRTKSVNWSKVKTVEEITLILSGIFPTNNVKVDEELWDNPQWKHLLGATITEKTYYKGMEMERKEYEE